MTMNDMDTEALLLDQTCFALDAEAFDTVQGLVDKPPGATAQATPHAHMPVALGYSGRSYGQEHARAIACRGIQTVHERSRAVDKATYNKSFNHHACNWRPLRKLAEYTALVGHSLSRHELPAGRAFSGKQIVATVSQQLTARLGAGFNGHAPTRMARLVGWIAASIRHPQGGCAAHSRQILVTAPRALTPHQGLGVNPAEVIRVSVPSAGWSSWLPTVGGMSQAGTGCPRSTSGARFSSTKSIRQMKFSQQG